MKINPILKPTVIPKADLQQVRDLRGSWHNFAFISTKFLHDVQDGRDIAPKKINFNLKAMSSRKLPFSR